MRFTVPGKVRGKGRPRMTRNGHVFTPKETVQYENLVKLCASGGGDMLQGPVTVWITAHMARPKGHYGTGRNAGKLKGSAPALPVVKPDADNIAKIICDACNGIAYKDDSQVVSLNVRKVYAGHGEGERVDVVMCEERREM